MTRRQPRSTRTDKHVPYTTFFRSRLAGRENKADIINGINLGGQSSDVSSILIDLTQRETMNISSGFAKLLQREASPFVEFRTAYHRFASLVVLKAPDTPSVLFETGYITNADDVRFLTSREGQSKIARRSEEHTSELQSLMRISYAVFCL